MVETTLIHERPVQSLKPEYYLKPEALTVPLTTARAEELSAIAAANTVDGYIRQDQGDFDASSLHFSIVFQALFPEYDSETLLKAAEAYVSALFTQSKLKDETTDRESKLHDPRWEFVRGELIRMCNLLNIPTAYGSETCELFRYHSVRDDFYLKHLLESHRLLMKRVANTDRHYRELAGIYLAAIAFHDHHDQYGVLRGRELMHTYYNIIFLAKIDPTRN